jgi:hypothetical protein
MANNDRDLFDRLRQAGVRKQVAKTLSEIGEGASKQALRAGRSAVSELRALADEIERRLPSATPDGSATGEIAGRTSTPSRAASPRASRSRAASATASNARRPATQPKHAAAPTPQVAAASGTSVARAPRGENKAKILESLKAGPMTASEIAEHTGIGTGTVSSTLTKMAKAREIVKADRGYGLPK